MTANNHFTRIVSLTAGILSASAAFTVTEFDQDVTPDAIFGSGNSNGGFTTDHASGIELGLRAKIPFVGLLNSNGDGSYSYSLAETDHDSNAGTANRWNFDFAVNTDFDGAVYTGDADLENVDTSGRGDDGNLFVFDDTYWGLNMKIKGLAPGHYTLSAVSGDLAEYDINPTCMVGVSIQ